MKKIFYFAALALSVIAFSSCTDKQANGNNNGSDSTATEQEGEAKMGPMGTFLWEHLLSLRVLHSRMLTTFLISSSQAAMQVQWRMARTSTERPLSTTTENLLRLVKPTVSFQEMRFAILTTFSSLSTRTLKQRRVMLFCKDAKAKKGDVVLTWWQSGSGMERAIVTDDSDPTQPKVHYLDLSYKGDGSGFAEKHDNEQLAVKDDGKYNKGILVNAVGDKVLYLGFAGKLIEANKSDVKLLPVKPAVNVGDNVKSVFVGTFSKDTKVEKIDSKLGRIWVKEGDRDAEPVSIFEVMK